MAVSQTPPFPPPEDQDQKNIIDKLANFVARNGSKFEDMTKEKQKGNPKFAFLFSGEHYNYYRWKVSFEIAQQQTQQHLQNQQQLAQQATAQFPTNPQVHLVQQAIVQQSINTAPWQQAQQQAQQQMQALQQQAQATAARYQPPAPVQQQADEVDMTELENLLHKIMESCTKDSISSGKNFIFTNAKTKTSCFQISQYLLKRALGPGMQFQHKLHIVYLVNDILHHCQRKGAQDLQKSLQDIVVPLFFCTQIGESAENLQKITKVLGIWESHNLFEPSLLQELKNTEAGQSNVDAAREQMFNQGFYVAPEHRQPYYQQPQDTQQNPQSDLQAPGREDNLKQPKVEGVSKETRDEAPQQVIEKGKEENTEKMPSEDAKTRIQNVKQEEAAMQQPFQPPPYQQHPPPFPPPFGDQRPQFYGRGPPPFPPHFPPPPYVPDFRHPPPMFGGPRPPNFHDEGYHVRPPPPQFRGPPQQFDYQHQMPEFEQFEGRGPPPPMVNDYNHGRMQEEEGYGMEEYEIPPEPSIPEPIIPTAMYYDLPAGLMAPLVGLPDVDYKPIDPASLRLPAPQPPSERLLSAVEAFYSPPSHERPRNSEGWEQSGLFEFYKAKLKYIKDREEAEKHKVQELPPSRSRSQSRSPRPRSRSRSQSPRQRRSRSRSRSPRRRHSRSKSISPRKRRSRSRSRSRSKSRSRSRSKSRSRSISPMFKSNRSPGRSPTPPSFHPSYTSKVPEQRLDESNVGHQMLKKMGWEGAGLGRSMQGIQDPISGGEIRDKFDKFKGVGADMKDPFEAYRKSKSYSFLGSRIAKSEAKAAAKAAARAERKKD